MEDQGVRQPCSQDDFRTALLGQTGLRVGRLGIGSSYGVSARSIEWAVEQGVGYLYWGTLRRKGVRDAIRSIARKDRSRIVVVVQSYSRSGRFMRYSLEKGLRDLKLDYSDVLLLGWWQGMPPLNILEEAHRLQEGGKTRFLAISTHHRPYGLQVASKNLFDILHVRYNAAHRGAEKEIFDHLGEQRPGIVTYTTTRWGTLMKKPKQPTKLPVPTATDCYRFALSNPCVDVCLCGPKDHREMKEAVAALNKGPMTEEELSWMRAFGDIVHEEAPRASLFMTAISTLDLRWGAHP